MACNFLIAKYVCVGGHGVGVRLLVSTDHRDKSADTQAN